MISKVVEAKVVSYANAIKVKNPHLHISCRETKKSLKNIFFNFLFILENHHKIYGQSQSGLEVEC
jgi:hypothetical protein